MIRRIAVSDDTLDRVILALCSAAMVGCIAATLWWPA